MAVEAKRGCGYRKIGGLYLVGTGLAVHCDRLPFVVEVCHVCGQGIKQTLGFTWVDWKEYAGSHEGCKCVGKCSVCQPDKSKYGLLWVGKKFYSPKSFVEEAVKMGVSKRISHIPRDLELGKDWILLAHPEGGKKEVEDKNTLTKKKTIKVPAIFYAFRPVAVEKVVTESQAKDKEEMEKLEKRGITPVVVPDSDPDHKGSVYKKDKAEETDNIKGGAL